jgi:hypothetical protein
VEKKTKQLVTQEEALVQLKKHGITHSIQTLRRWVREGKILAQKTPNRKQGYLIPDYEIQRYIDEQTGGYLKKRILELDLKIEKYRRECSLLQSEKNRIEQQEQQSREDLKKLQSAWSRVKKWTPIINSLNKLEDQLQDMVLNGQLPIGIGILISKSLPRDQQHKLKEVFDEDIYEIREQIDDLIEFVKHGASTESIMNLFNVRASTDFRQKVDKSEEHEDMERKYIQLLISHAADDEKVNQLIRQMEREILGYS